MSMAISVCATAAAVRAGQHSAVEIVQEALTRIAARDGAINAFTTVTAERALGAAAAVDARRAGVAISHR
jgi:1-carboxybiuret hydrolase